MRGSPAAQRAGARRRRVARATSVGLALVAAALIAAGCSEGPGAAAPPPAPAPQTEKASLPERLRAIREQIASAPGRTGILAEERRYSLNDEELIIRDFFQDREGGYFVDVGCAWPINASNTYYLEKHLGWRGIGIDALQDYAAAWERERPASKFYSFLVTHHTADAGRFFKSPNPGLSSTNPDLASGKNYGAGLEPEKIEVAAITLDALLEREGVEKIDLLSMDIEGHERAALAGFDIERFRPELVVIEGKSKAVATYFMTHGYEQIDRYVPFDPINRYFRPKQAGAR